MTAPPSRAPNSGSSDRTADPASLPKDSLPSPSEGGPSWADRQLPPIKPPTTGLLMQLFFIPMVIVAVIVAVFLMFGWLTESGRKPTELASDLEKMNLGSQQKAYDLTLRLRQRGATALRQDEKLAEQLSTTLIKLLPRDTEAEGSEVQSLQVWLCQALGLFEIDRGLPALVQALDSRDLQIRRSAVQAIGILAANVQGNLVERDTGLLPSLRSIGLSRPEGNEDETSASELRTSAAFTLGLLGSDSGAREVLALMLADPHPDVRYNAATGLARHHDPRAVPRLVEMIQLENAEVEKFELAARTSKLKLQGREPGSDSEAEEASLAKNRDKLIEWKKSLVIEQGLNGIQQLYKVEPRLEVDRAIREAVRTLAQAEGLSWRIKNLANELDRTLSPPTPSE